MRSIRTDLAMERRQMAGEIEGIETETRQNGEMEISTVRIQTQRAAKALGREDIMTECAAVIEKYAPSKVF